MQVQTTRTDNWLGPPTWAALAEMLMTRAALFCDR